MQTSASTSTSTTTISSSSPSSSRRLHPDLPSNVRLLHSLVPSPARRLLAGDPPICKRPITPTPIPGQLTLDSAVSTLSLLPSSSSTTLHLVDDDEDGKWPVRIRVPSKASAISVAAITTSPASSVHTTAPTSPNLTPPAIPLDAISPLDYVVPAAVIL